MLGRIVIMVVALVLAVPEYGHGPQSDDVAVEPAVPADLEQSAGEGEAFPREEGGVGAGWRSGGGVRRARRRAQGARSPAELGLTCGRGVRGS